ncbi:DUF2726 domain-containing protein [Aquitalea aquatilis]|uniref:DUF2726 domain-containing protein n=1 Tax=Aquitalea aquatilis TaxID=1537400 RepID=UPI0010BDCA67|nr:DUF2726 domain-containing protein [Aquitalea aquatilis]
MFALIVVIVLIAVIAAAASQAKKKSPDTAQPEKKKANYGNAKLLAKSALLSKSEQECYQKLVSVLQPDFLVLAQVSLGQLLRATGGTKRQNDNLYYNFASRKAADFVICRADFSVVVVVELDDPSHDSKKDRDADRDKTLRDAGHEVLRLPSIPTDELLQRYAASLRAREAAKKA